MRRMYIALDFDGTLVTHESPEIGRDIGAFELLRRIQKIPEVRLILNTMRSGESLARAVDCCLANGLQLFGVNSNPSQSEWTSSPKVYAHIYVDDVALGTPLVQARGLEERDYVDWAKMGPMLEEEINHLLRLA